MSDIFAVLADPTRRAILQALAAKSQSVGELVEVTAEAQPSISKHLKTLKEAGLVSVEADGQTRIYSLDSGPLAEVLSFVNELAPGIGGVAAGSTESTDPVEKTLVEAAEVLAGWVNSGAAWVGAKISETVADANIDTAEMGRELGRKLADARLNASGLAADAKTNLGADIAELAEVISMKTSELADVAGAKIEEIRSAAKNPKSRPAQKAADDGSTAGVVQVEKLDEAEF